MREYRELAGNGRPLAFIFPDLWCQLGAKEKFLALFDIEEEGLRRLCRYCPSSSLERADGTSGCVTFTVLARAKMSIEVLFFCET